MLKIILEILIILWVIVNLGVCFAISFNINDSNPKTGSLIALKEFVEELFWERNILGIILSVIVFIITIPAMILVLTIQIFFWIGFLISCVWDLGNKKEQ